MVLTDMTAGGWGWVTGLCSVVLWCVGLVLLCGVMQGCCLCLPCGQCYTVDD